MNSGLVLAFGIAVVGLLAMLSGLGMQILRELEEIHSAIESMEGESIDLSPE